MSEIKEIEKLLNQTSSSTEVIRTQVTSISETMREFAAEHRDLRNKVHHLDKNAITRDEYNEAIKGIKDDNRASHEALAKKIEELDKRIWKIIIVVTALSAGVNIAADKVLPLLGM